MNKKNISANIITILLFVLCLLIPNISKEINVLVFFMAPGLLLFFFFVAFVYIEREVEKLLDKELVK